MNTQIIDTNILVRYLIRDNEQQFQKALDIIKTANTSQQDLYIDEVVVAETVWVLKSYYQQEKSTICESLTKLINLPVFSNPRKPILLQAISIYTENNISYVDAWLLSIAHHKKLDLQTFDQKLTKLSKTLV